MDGIWISPDLMEREPTAAEVLLMCRNEVKNGINHEIDKKRRKAERYQVRKHRSSFPDCQGCGKLTSETTPEVVNGYSVRPYPEIHHLKPIRDGGTWRDGLVTLCRQCHWDIHTVDGKHNNRHINEELTAFYQRKYYTL